ncbi:MAG: nickel pincer cofactor biosynthesis protein LarB [Armatimonadota bacterium]
MNADQLLNLLRSVSRGDVTPEQALEALRLLPYEDIGFARIDHHRALRTGFPEVVFCQGKRVEQIVEIVKRLASRSSHVLATRAGPEAAEAIRAAVGQVVYHADARIVEVGQRPRVSDASDRYVAVVSAGTADLPVAEEAAVTAEAMGSRVRRLYDVGVAGLHRLLDSLDVLMNANVIVVVAGMEGALASVVGGLVRVPVVAVPTSVGYGASFGGLSALLTMLNSCAAGVAVVNIDNGFGAGYYAHLVNR